MKNQPALIRFSAMKYAAALAVCAGLATATVWLDRPTGAAGMPGALGATVAIDPTIPVVTIIGKRLNAAEKEQMAQDDRRLESQRMTTVSGDAKARSPRDSAL